MPPCNFTSVSMCGSEKESEGTRRFEQYTLFIFRRLLDFSWEWSLYSEEWDPDVEISLVEREGGKLHGATTNP